ncbi:Lignin-forming anionic peroxidase [Linum grandiflorum]
MLQLSQSEAQQQLSTNFYANTCPNALSTIRRSITTAISRERRMAASLLRLHFHDCFVQGCDASILLDPEKTALPNDKSVRGYQVIDAAKAQVERICPGVVSCADIIAVAARDASAYVGGPTWNVKLGRRDSTDLPTLISEFEKKGLNAREMVVLSGAHTLGFAQCFTFRDRIYDNGAKAVNKIIDSDFARKKKKACPALDTVTPKSFDNNYFKTLMRKKGLLESDQVLYSGGSTDGIVEEYSKDAQKFSSDFAAAMVKMGDIGVITGNNGQIRKVCRKTN